MTNRQLISRMYTREKLLNYRRKFVLLSPNTSFHFVHARTQSQARIYRGCEGLIRQIRTGDCEVVNWNEIAVANAPI